jgi:hypothetical protein
MTSPLARGAPIESSGIVLFIDYAIVDTSSGFSIELIWSHILAVPNPGIGNPPTFLTYIGAVEPSPRAKAAVWKRRYKMAGLVIAAFVALGLILYSSYGFLLMYVLFPALGLLKKLFDNDAPSALSRAARAAEARLRELQHCWQCEATNELFNSTLEDLRDITDEYRKLPERRKQKIRELERALRASQLQHFLEQFDIASAKIPHIKDGRKVMLSSYGIDNAADVSASALQAVPGFGHLLAMQLIIWRQSLEAKFKLDPSRGIDPADIQHVDHDIAKRRSEIEALLAKGPGELKQLRQRIITARDRLQGQLEQAYKAVAQAQADERAAT